MLKSSGGLSFLTSIYHIGSSTGKSPCSERCHAIRPCEARRYILLMCLLFDIRTCGWALAPSAYSAQMPCATNQPSQPLLSSYPNPLLHSFHLPFFSYPLSFIFPSSLTALSFIPLSDCLFIPLIYYFFLVTPYLFTYYPYPHPSPLPSLNPFFPHS